MDSRRALAGGRRERRLSRRQSRHGLAAGGLSGPDGQEPRALVAALCAAGGRASCWRCSLMLLPFALLVAFVAWQREIQIGASLAGDRLRRLSCSSADAIRARSRGSRRRSCAVVVRGRDGARRRPDAGADLSRPLPRAGDRDARHQACSRPDQARASRPPSLSRSRIRWR